MAAPSTSGRFTALRPWSSNPLMRRGDRTLAVAWLVALGLALIAIPLSVWAGAATYQVVADRAAEAQPTTATVTAILDTDPASTDTSATVSWILDGQAQTTQVPVPRGTRVGASTQLWLDADGRPLINPGGTFEHVLCGVWVGLLAWLGTAALALAVLALIRGAIARRHDSDWEHEWHLACTADGWAAR